jgi:Uma2 family endonuclease
MMLGLTPHAVEAATSGTAVAPSKWPLGGRVMFFAVSSVAQLADLVAPLAVSDDSLPEPDVAVVPSGDYDRAHPKTAFLVVEVADSSLNKDRLVKAALYAAGGVEEYWIVDLAAGVIEVHSDPVAERYRRAAPASPGESLRLRAFPDVEIPVGDILR